METCSLMIFIMMLDIIRQYSLLHHMFILCVYLCRCHFLQRHLKISTGNFSNFSGLMGQSLLISCFAKAALHIIAGQLSEEKIKAYAGWIDECELMMRFASRSYDFGAHAAR